MKRCDWKLRRIAFADGSLPSDNKIDLQEPFTPGIASITLKGHRAGLAAQWSKLLSDRMNGTVKVERKSGTEVFGFKEYGDISWSSMGDGKKASVCFAVEADAVIEPLEFTEDVCSSPFVEAQAFDSDFDPTSLAGKKYKIPKSYDEIVGDHVSVFYYAEHLELDEIEIEVLDQQGDICDVRWTGLADDNCADPPARTRITVEGRFRIIEMTDSNE